MRKLAAIAMMLLLAEIAGAGLAFSGRLRPHASVRQPAGQPTVFDGDCAALLNDGRKKNRAQLVGRTPSSVATSKITDRA